MAAPINSLADLRSEIFVLRLKKNQQEAVIASKFDGPGATFSTVMGLIKGKTDGKKSFAADLLSSDMVSNISRIIVPFFLNTVIFKRSGFITKALVTFLSQKAAKKVNTGTIASLAEKVKDLFTKPKNTVKKPLPRDYGIPPDSETY